MSIDNKIALRSCLTEAVGLLRVVESYSAWTHFVRRQSSPNYDRQFGDLMNGNCFTKLSQELLDTSRCSDPRQGLVFDVSLSYEVAGGIMLVRKRCGSLTTVGLINQTVQCELGIHLLSGLSML